MVRATLSELVSGSMSKIRGVFSNVGLERISKPVALLGSGILFSLLALSPAVLVGVLPDALAETFNLAIKRYAKRKGAGAETTEETLNGMSAKELSSLIVELQESVDDLMRKDEEARVQIIRLIKESMRSEEFLDYLNEQQSLTVLIQENLRDLLREFPDMREDINDIGSRIDSLMDQVRDVRKLLIELRDDVRQILAHDTGRREKRGLKTRVSIILGQMRASSNVPERMRSVYQTYYLKAVTEEMGHKEYEELIDNTRAWENDVAELTKTWAKLLDAQGREFLFTREPLVLGRAPGYETFQLEDRFTSGVHACLMYDWKSGQYFIRDLNSKNGTFLNGKKIKNSPVRSGDEILMGRTSVIVEIDQRLRIVSTTGLERMLEGYLIVFGRSPSSKILVCKNPYVSRLHAIIIYHAQNNSYRIRDLNSTNRTYVNDEKLTGEVALRNGDVISLARTADFSFVRSAAG